MMNLATVQMAADRQHELRQQAENRRKLQGAASNKWWKGWRGNGRPPVPEPPQGAISPADLLIVG